MFIVSQLALFCFLLGEPGLPGANGKDGERGKTHCYQRFQFNTSFRISNLEILQVFNFLDSSSKDFNEEGQ